MLTFYTAHGHRLFIAGALLGYYFRIGIAIAIGIERASEASIPIPIPIAIPSIRKGDMPCELIFRFQKCKHALLGK